MAYNVCYICAERVEMTAYFHFRTGFFSSMFPLHVSDLLADPCFAEMHLADNDGDWVVFILGPNTSDPAPVDEFN